MLGGWQRCSRCVSVVVRKCGKATGVRCASSAPLSIPVIDVGPAINSADAQSAGVTDVAAAIAHACETVGFFAVTGHGMTRSTLQTTWQTAWDFFDTVNAVGEEALREQVSLPHSTYPYGYAPMEFERLAGSLGAEDSPPDLKETFSIGPLTPPVPLPQDPVAGFAFSPNLWPSTRHITTATFRSVMEQHYTACNDLSNQLLRLFAIALDLPPDFFSSKVQHHMSALRLNNYPALTQAPLDGQLRAGEHCDYGSLTLLLPHDDEFNGRGDRSEDGLQVFIQGEWRPVVVPPGVFVVNIGDLMARWTNDTWRSTLHRVVVPQHDMEQQGPAPRRMSLAFFHQPDWDAEVAVLPSCVGTAARYPPTTAGQHIKAKFEAAGISVQ